MNWDTIKRALIFSLIGVFFCCIPISASASDDAISSVIGSVNSSQRENIITDRFIEPGSYASSTVNYSVNRFSLNNTKAIILNIRANSTFQFSRGSSPVSSGAYLGYWNFTVFVTFADGTRKQANWTTTYCYNNYPASDITARYSAGNKVFECKIDVTDKQATHITDIDVVQHFYPSGIDPYWTLYFRQTITDFSLVHYSDSDVVGSIGDAADDITDSINQNGDKISGAIQEGNQEIVDSIQQDPGNLDFPDMEDIAGSYIDQIDTEQIGDAAGSLKSSYNALSAQSGNTLTAMGEILDWLFLSCDEPLIYLVSWGGLVIGLTGIMIALFQRK